MTTIEKLKREIRLHTDDCHWTPEGLAQSILDALPGLGFCKRGDVVTTELTRDDLLVLLIEECSEVTQAATKCIRFGWDRGRPEYGVNHEVLANEVGDVLAIIEALPLDQRSVEQTRAGKIRKAERAKRLFGVESATTRKGEG